MDLRNPDIMKRGTGVAIQLGVVGVPRTEGVRTRASRREVGCRDTIYSKQQMDNGMNALSEHGVTAQALTGSGRSKLQFLTRLRSLCRQAQCLHRRQVLYVSQVLFLSFSQHALFLLWFVRAPLFFI